jgi:hypothetical protein
MCPVRLRASSRQHILTSAPDPAAMDFAAGKMCKTLQAKCLNCLYSAPWNRNVPAPAQVSQAEAAIIF